MRCAIYARVSPLDQEPENQLVELRRYVGARGWTSVEHVDRGVSGSKDRRPALDSLLKDARRRRFDVLVVWRLDRLGRNLRHLITLLEDLQALGVAFVSLNEGIDATTPAGKLQMHILGAIAEFERARIAERVKAGLQRARAQGKRLGRPRKHRLSFPAALYARRRESGAYRSPQRRPGSRRVCERRVNVGSRRRVRRSRATPADAGRHS
jgi:DNA invertase Pin-like site-specific DNA recombinase